jgi:hypothetical protein
MLANVFILPQMVHRGSLVSVICGTFLCDFAETWRSLREKPIFHAKPAKISKAAEDHL